MFTWGVIVFVGLWLLLADVAPVRRAKLMGNPWLIHVIVIGSGLAIHGGSADGAMAAIVSGVLQRALRALPTTLVRLHPRGTIWHPGVVRSRDPRSPRHEHAPQYVISTPKPRRASSRRWSRAPPPGSGPGRPDVDTLPMNASSRRLVPGHQRAAARDRGQHPRLPAQPLAHLPPGLGAGRPGAQGRARHHRRASGTCARSRPPPTSTRSRRRRTCTSG